MSTVLSRLVVRMKALEERESLYFLFCLDDQVTVIGIQKVSDRTLVCL